MAWVVNGEQVVPRPGERCVLRPSQSMSTSQVLGGRRRWCDSHRCRGYAASPSYPAGGPATLPSAWGKGARRLIALTVTRHGTFLIGMV